MRRLTELARGVARAALCALLLAPLPALAQKAYDDLILAVVNDRVGELKSLLARGADPDSVDPGGDPLLVIAARNGNLATVDALLLAKAKPDAKNAHGDSAMMLAALKGQLDIVRRLRAAGATLDPPGWTPLIYAATGGHEPIVRYLLDQGANINATSPNGTTALMMAIREHRLDVAELLLRRGADVSRRNDAGLTALAYAEQGNETELAQWVRAVARGERVPERKVDDEKVRPRLGR
jgi:ankyrin repeat protein